MPVSKKRKKIKSVVTNNAFTDNAFTDLTIKRIDLQGKTYEELLKESLPKINISDLPDSADTNVIRSFQNRVIAFIFHSVCFSLRDERNSNYIAGNIMQICSTDNIEHAFEILSKIRNETSVKKTHIFFKKIKEDLVNHLDLIVKHINIICESLAFAGAIDTLHNYLQVISNFEIITLTGIELFTFNLSIEKKREALIADSTTNITQTIEKYKDYFK